jgi:type IV pilus assembly protein PilN
MDPWILGTVAIVVLGLGSMGFLFMSTGSRHSELTVSVEEAIADSVRYADIIERTQRLQAQRDSIAEKVAVIQEIDQDRYMWAHIMDEIARALPDYTWLTTVLQIGVLENPQLNIRGRTGNQLALTNFMNNLEASPFLRGVEFVSSTQSVVADAQGNGRTVYDFELNVEYEDPPPELIETVPLFDNDPAPAEGEGDAAAADSGAVAQAEGN